jgi:hypothetical protein
MFSLGRINAGDERRRAVVVEPSNVFAGRTRRESNVRRSTA